jgi:hypothetical protein
MLKLDLKKEPFWIDLQADARVKVKPLTSALMHMAQADAVRAMLALQAERKARLDAGADASDLPDLENEQVRHSLSETALITALATHAIIAWENVMKPEGGELAELTRENITQLMEIWFINQEFGKKYMRQLDLLEAEGNVSRPVANGTSAAGRATAGRAKKKISPAAGAKPAQ